MKNGDVLEKISFWSLNEKQEKNLVFSLVDVGGEKREVLIGQNIPRQLEDGAIFICLDGEAEVRIDLKSYSMSKNDICVVFPFTVVQAVNRSSDFRGRVIGLNTEFIRNIQMPSTTSLYLYIKENPCISISDIQLESLLELCEMTEKKYRMIDNPIRHEIVDKLLIVIMYEIVEIYSKGKPASQRVRSRQDIIFQNFLFSLTKNYKIHREVNFYAEELCITPGYFSYIVKEKTGMSAAGWINLTVINQAKMLLRTTHMTIQQISDSLNFANPSFFGQYFKKHTGTTPMKWRNYQKN